MYEKVTAGSYPTSFLASLLLEAKVHRELGKMSVVDTAAAIPADVRVRRELGTRVGSERPKKGEQAEREREESGRISWHRVHNMALVSSNGRRDGHGEFLRRFRRPRLERTRREYEKEEVTSDEQGSVPWCCLSSRRTCSRRFLATFSPSARPYRVSG